MQELGDGAGEAVRDQQRLGAGLAGPDVQEVDALAVDLGGELWVGVELRLGGAPVVAGPPVLRQLLQVAHRHAAGPPRAGQLAGPAGTGQPVVQVLDVGLGDLDTEGLDAVAHRASPCQRARRGGAWAGNSCAHAGRLGTIEERYVPRWPVRIEECWKPRRGCCACCPCCRHGVTGPVPSSPPGSASPPAPSATTWTGCAGSAIRSTRGRAWPADTGSAPAVPCRRCCSTTRRRWRSRSGCAPPRAARSRGSRRPRCVRWRSCSRCFPRGCAAGSAPFSPTRCRCRRAARRWTRTS